VISHQNSSLIKPGVSVGIVPVLLNSFHVQRVLSVFPSAIIDQNDELVFEIAFMGIANLLKVHPKVVEIEISRISQALLLGITPSNEDVVIKGLEGFSYLYECAADELVREFHRKVNYCLLLLFLKRSNVELQQSSLNVIGSIVMKKIEDWFEEMMNQNVVVEITEFAFASTFEMRIGIFKLLSLVFGRTNSFKLERCK
jgi:hypothetical protein